MKFLDRMKVWNSDLSDLQDSSADAFEVSEKQNNPMFTKPGGNVAFTCPYKIGDSVQRAMWERIKADWVDIVILCNSSGKQSFGSDFKERTPVDCSDQENSKIVFQNITASDFAMYCRVAAGRNKNCVMSFTVAATWDHKWFTTYIAEGISAAVLLLNFLLIFCNTTAYHKNLLPTVMEDPIFMAYTAEKEEEKNHHSGRQRRFMSTAKMSHTDIRKDH